jgi:hypothetical protein
MDELLKLAADAGHEVSTAEQAADEEAYDSARDALDRAADALQVLRERWPSMSPAERAIIGPSAQAVRDRREACVARVPVRRVVSQGTEVVDPDQDLDPEAAA